MEPKPSDILTGPSSISYVLAWLHLLTHPTHVGPRQDPGAVRVAGNKWLRHGSITRLQIRFHKKKTGNADPQKSELRAPFPENLAMQSVIFRVPFLGSKNGPKTGLESYPV